MAFGATPCRAVIPAQAGIHAAWMVSTNDDQPFPRSPYSDDTTTLQSTEKQPCPAGITMTGFRSSS